MPSAERNFRLEPEKCLADFQRQQELKEQYLSAFASHRCFVTSYEHLVNNPKQELGNIQDFLGVVPCDLKTITLKTGEKNLKNILINYDELYGFFKGSEYECFFD